MQILGKRSKILLILISVVMLVAIGISFAMWDISAVKATNGDFSSYANVKVGEVIIFGKYYQTGKRVNNDETKEYEKTDIEWIVVDKDERTGQLTLLSKKILAAGSYFGNWYYNSNDTMVDGGYYYNNSDKVNSEVGENPYNQAYAESTARAFLNNLERRDLGGDSYASNEYKTSVKLSDKSTGKLLTSVGFSNRKYYINDNIFQRPITNLEYKNRPATLGFYDEAFSDSEKAMIVPKVIAGYTGFRWPAQTHEPSQKSYVEGAVDKVWLPSTTELNIMVAEDNFTNPSDESSSTAFEYFKNYRQYKNQVTGEDITSLADALKTTRTDFLKNDSKAMNYSIPVYQFQSTAINTEISTTRNSSDYYWTRSPMSVNHDNVRYVLSSGSFSDSGTRNSYIGIRPCIILKY